MRNIKGIVKNLSSKTGEIQLKNINPNASDKEIRDFLSLYAKVLPESFVWKEAHPELVVVTFVEKEELPTRKPEISERTPAPLFPKGSEPAQGTLLRIVLLAVRSLPLISLSTIRERFFHISKKPRTSMYETEVSVMLTKLIKRGLVQRVGKGLYKAI